MPERFDEAIAEYTKALAFHPDDAHILSSISRVYAVWSEWLLVRHELLGAAGKPKLITICDVSDSVRNASRFMLQLVWSLQECFSRVQSYVFVSEIAEVTQAFSSLPVERAIEWALKGAPVDFHCRSDFGYAFNRFARTELERLDRRTTVMILGDARNNYNDPQAWALRMIRERVRGIIWLNPEGQWGWGIGDSVMPLYSPSCDIVKECRTVSQLVQVVDHLVHSWWRRGR